MVFVPERKGQKKEAEQGEKERAAGAKWLGAEPYWLKETRINLRLRKSNIQC